MQATQPELSKDLRLRRALASFLQEAGIKLHLPQTTIAFAIVLMHKHLSQLDIVSEHFILVQAILFVSSKVMETPVDIDMKYSALKMKVIEREQEVLRSLGFDLQGMWTWDWDIFCRRRVGRKKKSEISIKFHICNVVRNCDFFGIFLEWFGEFLGIF